MNRRARLTERLRAWVEALAELLPITIKEIDKARLQRKRPAQPPVIFP